MNLKRILRRARRLILRAREEGIVGTARIAAARLRSAALRGADGRYIDFSKIPLRELPAILKQSSPLPIKIKSIHLEATRYCNLRCKGCLLTANIESGLWTYDHMKLEEFKTVCTHLPAAHVLTLHNLGEPSMNPHLREMVAFAKAVNKFDTVDITTNLLTRSPEYFLGLFEAGLDRMTVSVDSFDPEIAEKVRSRTNVARLRNALSQIVNRYASKLTIAIVVSRMNLHDIPNTLAVLDEMISGTGRNLFVSLIKFDSTPVPALSDWALGGAEFQVLSERISEWEERYANLTINPPQTDDHPEATDICDRPWVAPKITQEGILAVCGRHVEPAVSSEISDLKRRSFGEIVRDPQMVLFLENFIDESRQYCIGCEFDCSRPGRGALQTPAPVPVQFHSRPRAPANSHF